jgi:hypothetical protein
MLRRSLVFAALGAWPSAVWAQANQSAQASPTTASGIRTIEQSQIRDYEAENALECAFISATTNPGMRPIFRRYLLETHVVLPLTASAEDSPIRQVRIPLPPDASGAPRYFTGRAIYTSAARADAVLGADTPRIIINGRAALSRLRQSNVIINPGLAPMLTLEPADVAAYLEAPGESSAGPTQ